MTDIINVNSFNDRADLMHKRLMNFLTRLQKEYKASGKNDVDILSLPVEMKTIRKFKKITSGNPSLSFELGNRNQQNGETFLDNSDAFMPFDVAFGFVKAKPIVLGGAASPITNNQILTYPDKSIFIDQTDANSVIEWQALLSYYWGTWELSVNKKTIISELHGERLLKVAQMQQQDDAITPYYQNGKYAPLYNTPLLDGNKTITWDFRPADNADTNNAGGADGEENYGVFDTVGFVVKDLATALSALNTAFYWVK